MLDGILNNQNICSVSVLNFKAEPVRIHMVHVVNEDHTDSMQI